MMQLSQTSVAKELGYMGTVEEIYKNDHPDVIKWTKYFHDYVSEKRIFENFMHQIQKNIATARIVAASWYSFSEFMPFFLCRAASMVSNNLTRHYIIQTAFEELGMRDYKQIHSEMFYQAANSIGIYFLKNCDLIDENLIISTISILKDRLSFYYNDMQIMGILLGLELPAIENIETIFTCMAYDQCAEKKLKESLFFKIHREVEIEHVRLTVSNFLRFSKSVEDIKNFINGFEDGINFWSKFWGNIGNLVKNFN